MMEIVDLGRGRTKSKGINTKKTLGLLQEYRCIVLVFQLSAFSFISTKVPGVSKQWANARSACLTLRGIKLGQRHL